jgi:hypothetical protein
MDEHGVAWSAVGGVVATLFGGGAIAWVIAASMNNSGLAGWPAIPLGVAGAIGLYGLIAPLRGWRPWAGDASPVTAVLELEANIEDFRHRVRNGFDATPPTYWRHLLASNVWEKHQQTIAQHYADVHKEVADAYRAANAINERVSLDKVGRPIPADEDRDWFMRVVDGEMAHASRLLHDRAPRRP